ncbi:hypothetical protein MRX96_057285 [Rhipicephalus microplus]
MSRTQPEDCGGAHRSGLDVRTDELVLRQVTPRCIDRPTNGVMCEVSACATVASRGGLPVICEGGPSAQGHHADAAARQALPPEAQDCGRPRRDAVPGESGARYGPRAAVVTADAAAAVPGAENRPITAAASETIPVS